MIVVRNIGRLLTIPTQATGMGDASLGLVENAALVIDPEGRVRYAGDEASVPVLDGASHVDAGGRLVTPGLCDPHTHPIFAGSRANEFAMRVEGRSYAEIQAGGGGILSTVRATTQASDAELIATTRHRLDRFLSQGVTAIEAKSGYALTHDGELRLLRLLREVGERHPVHLAPTLLAHVPPPDLGDATARAAFIEDFAERTIAIAAEQKLATAFDVYCDAGAFTIDETAILLASAKAHGLMLRVHAEQFTHTGVADLAAASGARSVEHLELLGAETPSLLAAAGTVCNLLPGAALTLRLPWPDARRLIAAGCTVALGTDCNPGSSLTESQPLMMSLGILQMGLTVAEAWRAVTCNAAHAMGRAELGTLEAGAAADFVLWETDDHREVPQHLGAQLAHSVYVGGRCVYAR